MVSLLTSSGSRLELAPNRMYVLGRDASCDFVVEDVMCSRQHARVTVGGTGRSVTIEDLGSKNGTFVDGEPLVGRALLSDGSRIQIGTTVYLLSMLDAPGAGGAELLETGTVAFERGSAGRLRGVVHNHAMRGNPKTGFAGQLSLFPFVDVLQLLMRTARNGRLQIEAPGIRGKVEFRLGQVQAAQCGSRSGMDALERLARLEDGIFWVVETTAPVERSVKMSGDRLLFELCRVLDEDTREPVDD